MLYKGNLEKYFYECGCDFDIDRVLVQKINILMHMFSAYNMHADGTKNKLIVKNGRYEVESPDPLYNEQKEIFTKMILSFRFMK